MNQFNRKKIEVEGREIIIETDDDKLLKEIESTIKRGRNGLLRGVSDNTRCPARTN